MQSAQHTALSILQSQPLRYITALKLLHGYGAAITCVVADESEQPGVLLYYPPQLFPYDAHTYPDAEAIVLPLGDDAAVVAALLDRLPTLHKPVFKIVDPAVRQVVLQRYAVQRISGFVSYTSPPDWSVAPNPAVQMTAQLDHATLELFVAQGHDRHELQAHFAAEAQAFVLRQDDQVAAACYVFQNSGAIWEVAGVVTEPAFRRKGFARHVVVAAVTYLLAQQRIPRYQVYEGNTPSVGLAEAIGLHAFVTIEHFQ